MTKKQLKARKTENKLPQNIYIGIDKVEGYAKITAPEMEFITKRREAMQKAILQANTLAVKNAYQIGKASMPIVDGKVTVLHVKISPPKEETPFTELTPVQLLPPDVGVELRSPRYGEKFNIYVVSVAWTARWICLSVGEIDGLPDYPETKSKIKTNIGKNVYEFNCPQPILNKITFMEKTEFHAVPRPLPLKSFVEKYKSFDDAFVSEFEQTFFAELNDALLNLPKCPKECEETELSVTIGYPQPYEIKSEEVILLKERAEMTLQPNPQMVQIKFEEYTYVMTGRWSWSVQRACGQD